MSLHDSKYKCEAEWDENKEIYDTSISCEAVSEPLKYSPKSMSDALKITEADGVIYLGGAFHIDNFAIDTHTYQDFPPEIGNLKRITEEMLSGLNPNI